MCLYVLALGLLYRIFDLISRPNFDTAVFSQRETCFTYKEKEKFLPDEVRVSRHIITKQKTAQKPMERERVYNTKALIFEF